MSADVEMGTGLLTFLIGLITTSLPYVGITWKKCSRTSIITKRNTNWDGTEWVSIPYVIYIYIYIYIYSIMEYVYIPRVRACVGAWEREHRLWAIWATIHIQNQKAPA